MASLAGSKVGLNHFAPALMADILLNISFDEPIATEINKKPQAISQTKSTQFGKRKRQEGASAGPNHPETKKRRIDKSDENTGRSAPGPQKPRNVVSSLFTSNPKIPEPSPSLEEQVQKIKLAPSNAPLKDSSTFEGLGLNRLLVNHLQSKMNIQKPTSIQRASLPYLLKSYDPEITNSDVFIQSQTGSGKTLSYLLPIIQDLLPLSSLSYIDRSVGTLAIIIAPTRELAKQISDVLEELLKLRLRESKEVSEEVEEPRLTRWLVPGLLSGGATRSHEKARLRKGIPILVATPGRLLDHLQNTTSFDVGKCQWLVLDEADRLMELGFEETIQGILKSLEGRRNLTLKAAQEGQGMEIGGWEWRERRTVLCSATLREDVQKLAGTALRSPVMIKGGGLGDAQTQDEINQGQKEQGQTKHFSTPSQLSQKYIITPLKLRLVTLVALLRSILSEATKQGKEATKIIVFLSCTDSVDFHWTLLSETSMESTEESSTVKGKSTVEACSPLLPGASIYRLHGTLPLAERLAALDGFSRTLSKSKHPAKHAKEQPEDSDKPSFSSVLFCTSVASRGLDLAQVRAVVQYDLPTEGGANEYIHRVGRTARAGKGGEAWSFVVPSETEWVSWIENQFDKSDGASNGDSNKHSGAKARLHAIDTATVLQKGFGGKGKEYEDRATEVQLAFERWVMKSTVNSELARNGFQSHLRAYATHPSNEKHIFHVKNLHSGHLAKAFALREAPSSMVHSHKHRGLPSSNPSSSSTKIRSQKKMKGSNTKDKEPDGSDEDVRNAKVSKAEERMQVVVRSQGRLTKKGGVMMSSGASEFHLPSTDALEKLVH